MTLFVWSVLIPAVFSVISGVPAIIETIRVLRPEPRRQISYRVHLDNQVGAEPDVAGLAKLVVRPIRNDDAHDLANAWMALIRISNDSRLGIDPEHYVRPARFTFGNRKVIGVEVKDVDEQQHERLLGSDPAGHQQATNNANNANNANNEDRLTFDRSGGDNWVQLPKMQLNRGARFRMMVLLDAPAGYQHTASGVDGSAQLQDGPKGNGNALVREVGGIGPSKTTRRALGFGIVTTALLVVAILVLVFFRPPTPPNSLVPCASGAITLTGSTAFGQAAAKDLATQYQMSCQSSTVQQSSNDSYQGVLNLATTSDPNARAKDIAMSDGPESGYTQLTSHRIAVIILSVVVNKATGVSSLSSDDLRKIYSGQVTNWSYFRGGANQPITIVSRVENSGTRATFDQKILNNVSELPASSRNCLDRVQTTPAAPVTRCEMGTTDDLLNQVNAIPGAIGYAELSTTSAAQTTRYQHVDQVQLDGFNPDPESVKTNNYPFWTVEYAYTYGQPDPKSLSAAFLHYLGLDTAKAILQNDSYIPCTDEQGNLIRLC